MRRGFWLVVSCSVGWHLRSVLAWYCEHAGETSHTPNPPAIRLAARERKTG